MIGFRGVFAYHDIRGKTSDDMCWGVDIEKEDVMPDDRDQTAEPPTTTTSRQDPKSATPDPRDDLRERVAAHRRTVQSFLARRLMDGRRPETLRQ